MNRFEALFKRTRSVVIGMVHVQALPGSPRHCKSMDEIIETACKEAQIYSKAKMDGILIENMHDQPWCLPHQMGPETIAGMTAVCANIRRELPKIPLGIQVLSAANREALAIAKTTGLNFIRAEGFVFSHIGDEGPIHSCAADLLRYRKAIGAEDVLVFTDIKKKHSSHQITKDVDIAETAQAAELFLSDGVIVTGPSTAKPANLRELKAVSSAVSIPMLVGSGIGDENLHHYITANAVIIGSSLKMDGTWSSPLDYIRVDHVMRKVHRLRTQMEQAQPGEGASDRYDHQASFTQGE